MYEPRAVAVEQVSKRYPNGAGEVHALIDVSLEVPSGEFLSLMGQSGSGKSTLLNLIAGLDEPTSGRVVIAGQDLAKLSRRERSLLRLREVGFIFQSFNLLPSFTVEENVAWPLELAGARWREACERAAGALDRVGVPRSALRRRPAEISGGEQQRVAIARALVSEPSVVLADEPTGNLDSRTGQAVLDLLHELNRERAMTIVLVTHSPFAAAYGHRTVELADGRIVREVMSDSRAMRLPAGG